MRFKRSIQIEKGRLDLTPLVDVIFLLLIFFMLSSTFILQPGIKVDLPPAKQVPPHKEENMVVTITRENQVFFNNERTTLEGLKRRIRMMNKKNPNSTLIIKADTNTRHGNVVQIMNMARQAGIEKMAIATRPE
ncbi:MAG: biopolymer transporter ExbD [Candidatus Auribacterota bacterium]|jgi:biopolymer transport protein ExbD|nr:biopolymer transporter ExbD [Candidatus Auribacterota bacterium]